MLDIIRKRSSSWETKAIFGIIIIVFVFFFGYSSFTGGGRTHGGQPVVAMVNGKPITQPMFQLAFDSAYQFYKQIYKGDIPKEMMNQIQNSTLQQMINSELLKQFGSSIGISVSNEELIRAIETDPRIVAKGEKFDPERYQKAILPELQRRGIDFEKMVGDDILLKKTEAFLESSAAVSAEEAKEEFDQQNTKWSFEKIEIDPSKLVEEKKIEKAEDAEGIAKEILSEWQNGALPAAARKHGIDAAKVGPIVLKDRYQLFSDVAERKDLLEVFALTEKEPLVKAPLKIGGKWVVVRLAGIETPSKDAWEKEKEAFIQGLKQKKQQMMMQQWLAHLASKAKIKTYIAQED